MKINYKNLVMWILLCLAIVSFSCKKFLDEKSDKKLLVPSSVQDLEALLDQPQQRYYNTLAEELADNYSVPYNRYLSASMYSKNNYTWQKFDENYAQWRDGYTAVNIANVVLDNATRILVSETERVRFNEVKGFALFLRAYFFYHLSQTYAQPYEKQSAPISLGIPLRLDVNAEVISKRSSVKETYDRIIEDLAQSAELLPDLNPVARNRPSKAAAYAVMARVFLIMREFEKARIYADKSLSIKNTLIDFNAFNVNSSSPIARYNEEVLFHGIAEPNTDLLIPGLFIIDSALVRSYEANDLRMKIFFRLNTDQKTYSLKGNYSGAGRVGFYFSGISINEVYLIRAECYAREGNTAAALNDLNTLLKKRFINGTFVNITTVNSEQALRIILAERRKELVFNLTRWSDVRRLSNEPELAVSLVRNLNGQVYRLDPNQSFTMQIPKQVIDVTGMPQNP